MLSYRIRQWRLGLNVEFGSHGGALLFLPFGNGFFGTVVCVTAHVAAVEERARQAEIDLVRSQEKRKRRRTQQILVATVCGLLAMTAVGIAAVTLWQQAVEARSEAEAARDAEYVARTDAEASREKLAHVEYGRAMHVAQQEWLDNNVSATLGLLVGTWEDFRGWEWDYVHRLCHSELMTLKCHKGMLHSASFNADCSKILSGGADNTASVWNAQNHPFS